MEDMVQGKGCIKYEEKCRGRWANAEAKCQQRRTVVRVKSVNLLNLILLSRVELAARFCFITYLVQGALCGSVMKLANPWCTSSYCSPKCPH